VRALLALLFISFSSLAHSNDDFGDRFYVRAETGWANVGIGDSDFRPFLASVSVGGYFLKNIGLDLTIAAPLGSDDDAGFDVQLEEFANLSFRFDSPPIKRWSAFIFLGVSTFTVDQEGLAPTGFSTSVSETFTAGTGALGFKRQIADSRFSVVGTYRLHFLDEPIDVDSITFGVRAAWK